MKLLVASCCVVLAGFSACSLPDLKKKLEGAQYCEDPPDRYEGAPVVSCIQNPEAPGGLCCAYGYKNEFDKMCFHILCSPDCGSFEAVKSMCLSGEPEDTTDL